jgi:Zn-dependent protease with chaperone function
MNTIETSDVRHPKEATYLTIMYVFSIIIYILLFIPIILFAVFSIPFILVGVFTSWLSSLYFKAEILGNSVKVSPTQYPEIYNTYISFCQKANVSNIPDLFIYNGNGVLNALAMKVFLKKYIFMLSSIVDISYKPETKDEFNFYLGHELGHHAAGHFSIKRSILTAPAHFIPFLGAAYSRACELTADRYGLAFTGNIDESRNALINLAHGSKVLSDYTNKDAFEMQENEIPDLMGFISKLFATHPRLTIRVIELRNFSIQYQGFSSNQNITTNNYTQNTSSNINNPKRILIGRATNCDIIINDTVVSKMHAEIILENSNISIRDLGSTNGTFVNGAKLTSSIPHILKPSDIVKAGNSIINWQNYI